MADAALTDVRNCDTDAGHGNAVRRPLSSWGHMPAAMGDECGKSGDTDLDVANAMPMRPHGPRLDAIAFGVVALVIALVWLPTLASGGRINPNEDFLLHAARHEAVRKSLLEHRAFPLRSHWFGGGYPTLGEPEDPALNPLVVLSVVFGSVMGPKLVAFAAALASGLGTYALARYILAYTRWGALFSALTVGTSLYVVDRMESGSLTDVCPAYLPLCMLLVGLSCRGRGVALLLLPFVLYTMISDGKQAFFVAMLYLGVFCLLDVVPMFRMLAPRGGPRKLDTRALQILAVALGVTFLVGMVRLLPVLEFIGAKGGLMRVEPEFHMHLSGAVGVALGPLLERASGILGRWSLVTIGWLPIVLFCVAASCVWKRMLPWVIAVVLFGWLALADNAPLNLFGLLERVPVFSTIKLPYKYFAFPIVLSVGIGAGQFFWLLARLQPRWLEHLCAVVLIAVGVGFLYPKTTSAQLGTYTAEVPAWASIQQEEFFSIRGLGLPRKRIEPLRAVSYLNVLQNIGTLDWYTALPMAEHAIPRYFVSVRNAYVPNPEYRGEAFFVREARSPEGTLSAPMGPSAVIGADARSRGGGRAGYVAETTFRPNSIAVRATVRRPGILVINQNYHSAWKADQGAVLDQDGLLAVRLEQTGAYVIHLRYLPRSFVVGLVVSVVSIAGWVLFCWSSGARRLQRWRDGDTATPPHSGRAHRR